MLLLLLVLMPIDACFNVDAYAKIDLCVKVVNQSENPMNGSVVQCFLQKFHTFCTYIQFVFTIDYDNFL